MGKSIIGATYFFALDNSDRFWKFGSKLYTFLWFNRFPFMIKSACQCVSYLFISETGRSIKWQFLIFITKSQYKLSIQNTIKDLKNANAP